MESDPMNSFFGKLTDLFPQNKKHELQTLTKESPSMTSFHSLTKDSSMGDNAQWWDDFSTVVQTQHTNTVENRITKDNINKSELQIYEMDSAPEKEKLDMNVVDRRDHYSKTSNQDVTDGLADTLSKSLSEVSVNDSISTLDKQLEDSAVSTVDTKNILFSDCEEGSVNMSDQEFVSGSNDKNSSKYRLSQDIFENVMKSDSISYEEPFFTNNTEEPLKGTSCQDVLTETQNMKNLTNRNYLSKFFLSLNLSTNNKNDISNQSPQDVPAVVSKMDGNLQTTANVAPDVDRAASGINQHATLDNQQASMNMAVETTSMHCEEDSLTDRKAVSSNSPVNSRTVVITLTREESGIDTEKIQQRDDTAYGFFSQATCNTSSAESDSNFVEVHSPTTSQKPEIQSRQSEKSGGDWEFSRGSDLCDTEAHFTILSKLDNPDPSSLEPVPSVIQLKEEEEIDMQEDSQVNTQREQGLNGLQEERREKVWKMPDGIDTLMQTEGEMASEKMENIKEGEKIIQEDTMLDPVDTASVLKSLEEPSPSEKTTDPSLGSGSNQTVLSPTSLQEKKPLNLSFLFVGLRGTKKEAHEEKETPDQLQSPDQPNSKEVKGDFLEQIAQFLNSSKGEGKKKRESMSSPSLSPISQKPAETPEKYETIEETAISQSEETNKSPNTETALDAFKAFFTVKPIKKETSARMDMDAMKKKLNRDKEVLRAFFDRTSIKSPDKGTTDSKSEVSDERTPKRLQAIWPPPKPKDEEEKIGLKYTEAEHQAALLQQKREFDEEKEKIQADYKLQLFRTHEEHEVVLSKLGATIASLQRERLKDHHRDLRDVAVSTEDHIRQRVLRSICVQTDRETFIKFDEVKEAQSRSLGPQNSVPKNAELNSTKNLLNFTDKQKTVHPPPAPPALPQLKCDSNEVPTPPPPPPGPCAPTVSPLLAQPSDVSKTFPPPPPPPPTGCGLPPPPPPPFLHSIPPPPPGVGIFLSEVTDNPLRKQSVEPVCPMKPLYWTRIQIEDNRNDMLWSSLAEPEIINTNEFVELFAKATSTTKRKPLSEAYEKKHKAKKVIKLLDGKRSQAVGILISSLHLEMKDIQQAVLTLDNSVVDLDAIEALYENRAQSEELEKIKKHYETADEEKVKLLDKPEQFLYELSQIPEFSSRVHCFIFQSKFTDAVASIQCKTEIILHVCKYLLEENSVREVMGLVLALGNYMNGGSRARGQADGFGLEILPKLKDVKSRDNRMSLLDYIVSYYLRHFDENAGTEKSIFPLPEPQDVFLASQVKFEDISKDLRKLSRDLAVCEKDVLTVCTNSSQEHMHPFKEKMDFFIANAQKEVIATEHQVISAHKSFRYLAEYFGLKPRSGEPEVMPGHVFTLWFEFCNDFKIRWKRENKTISNQRLKEAQQSLRNITAEKKIETRRVHANGLKERLRLKEASLTSS